MIHQKVEYIEAKESKIDKTSIDPPNMKLASMLIQVNQTKHENF
jgi:hypothetical protein